MSLSMNYSSIPSDLFLTFGLGIKAIFDSQQCKHPVLVSFIDPFDQKLLIFKATQEHSLINPDTEVLIQRNELCCEAFLCFRNYVDSASHRNKPEWKDASSRIMEVIRRHGPKLTTLGYKAEVSAASKIISELQNQNAADLKTINATELLDEFQLAQADFDAVFHKGEKPSSGTENTTMWKARTELASSIKAIFSMVSLLNANTPTAELTALETALADLITRTMTSVKAADTRAKNQKKKDNEKKVNDSLNSGLGVS